LVCLYDTLGVDTVGFILNHSKPVAVFADNVSVNNLLKYSDIGKVHTIICYDTITEEQQTKANEKKLTLISFESLINSNDEEVPLPKLTRKTVFTFSYTSGTTG
jgi:long-chain acyl-CoA synthetase